MVIMPKVNVKENILTSNLKSDTKIDTKLVFGFHFFSAFVFGIQKLHGKNFDANF